MRKFAINQEKWDVLTLNQKHINHNCVKHESSSLKAFSRIDFPGFKTSVFQDQMNHITHSETQVKLTRLSYFVA